MIVTLKPGARIVGFAADSWQVQRHGADRQTHTVADANTFKWAFAKALANRLIDPGTVLDLSAFESLVRDASKRFDGSRLIRLGHGYTAYIDSALSTQNSTLAWTLTRDTGRGGKHAVQAGHARDLAGAIALAAWHKSMGARKELTIGEVGAFMLSIAQQLLDGACSEQGRTTAETAKELEPAT